MRDSHVEIPAEVGKLVMALPAAIRASLEDGKVENRLAPILFQLEEETVNAIKIRRE